MAILLTLLSIFFIPAVAFLRYFRVIGMGAPELPTVVLEGDADNLDASELQPLHNGKAIKNKKMRKLSLARRKFRRDDKLVERSDTTKNGPLNIAANGQMYQLVDQQNGAAMFI